MKLYLLILEEINTQVIKGSQVFSVLTLLLITCLSVILSSLFLIFVFTISSLGVSLLPHSLAG